MKHIFNTNFLHRSYGHKFIASAVTVKIEIEVQSSLINIDIIDDLIESVDFNISLSEAINNTLKTYKRTIESDNVNRIIDNEVDENSTNKYNEYFLSLLKKNIKQLKVDDGTSLLFNIKIGGSDVGDHIDGLPTTEQILVVNYI